METSGEQERPVTETVCVVRALGSQAQTASREGWLWGPATMEFHSQKGSLCQQETFSLGKL